MQSIFDSFLAMAPVVADISPQDVGIIIASLISAGGIGVGCYQSGKAKAMRIEPQPLEVKPHPDYATKQDMKRLEERQSAFEKEMREQLRDSEHKTHSRLDATNERLAEIAGGQKLLIDHVNSLIGHFVQNAQFTPTTKK